MGAEKLSLVYFETSVFLAFFNHAEGRRPQCEAAMMDAAEERIGAFTSALALAEVIRPDGYVDFIDATLERKIDSFLFNQPWLRVAWVDRRVALKARELSRDVLAAGDQVLKPVDAIHLATAVLHKAERLYTFDSDLLRLNGRYPGLTITHPVGQMRLNSFIDKDVAAAVLPPDEHSKA